MIPMVVIAQRSGVGLRRLVTVGPPFLSDSSLGLRSRSSVSHAHRRCMISRATR